MASTALWSREARSREMLSLEMMIPVPEGKTRSSSLSKPVLRFSSIARSFLSAARGRRFASLDVPPPAQEQRARGQRDRRDRRLRHGRQEVLRVVQAELIEVLDDRLKRRVIHL